MFDLSKSKPASPLSDSTILVTLLLLQVIPYGFGCSTFFVLAPEMKATFGWSYTHLGLINSGCHVALITMSYTAIWTTLLLGPRLAMTVSMMLSTCFFFLLAFFPSPLTTPILVIALMGSAAIAWVPVVPLISMALPPQKRGMTLSIVCSGPPIAMVMISLFAPYIVKQYHWQMVWAVTGCLSFLILTGCLPFLYRIPLDGEMESNLSAKLPMKLTLFFCLITFLNGLGDMPVLTYMGTVLQDRAAFSITDAGTGWFFCGVGGILSGPFLGNILYKLNSARKTLIYALPALAVASLLFVITQNKYILYFACFSLGLHHMAIYGIHGTYLARTMTLPQSTKAFGLVSASYGVGTVVGNYLVGIIRDLTGDFLIIYLILCFTLLVGTLLSLKLPAD